MVLMRYPLLLEELYAAIADHARVEIPVKIDAVAGLEARGEYIHFQRFRKNISTSLFWIFIHINLFR